MKLHLPVKLLRAVMALFVIHGAIAASWAEDATQQSSTTEYIIADNVTYGANGEKWIGIPPDEKDGYVLNSEANKLFTSNDAKQYSVTFDGANGAIQNAAIVGPSITVEKLKVIELTNLEHLICSEILTIQDNEKVAAHDNVVHRENWRDVFIDSKDVIIKNNGEVSISDNSVLSGMPDADGKGDSGMGIYGGILACNSGDYGENSLSISNNQKVDISNNKVVTGREIYGGVIFTSGPLNLENNGDVSFVKNIAEIHKYSDTGSVSGGAINVQYHTGYGAVLSIANNTGTVKFQDNYAIAGDIAVGGAIYNYGGEEGVFDNNAKLIFSGNKAEAVYESENGYVAGGAIYSETKLSFTNNGNIQFDNNSISTPSDMAMGGAIYSSNDVIISGNKEDVLFSGNTATSLSGEASGGGIYSSNNLIISDNKGVSFIGNGASGATAFGGAIYAYGDLSIVNNDGDVTFRGNYESDQSGTVLRSVCVDQGSFNLAASNDNSITFYDSIYVGAQENAVAVLNYYEDQKSGVGVASTGNIIFSGKNTGNDLIAAQEKLEQLGITAGAVDAEASRTSVIARDVYVAAGSLQVIDGAVLSLKDDDANNTSYDLLVVGKEHAEALAPHITYTDELSAKLVVSGGSMIEAGNITFGSTSQLVVREGADIPSAVFSLDEAATQPAVLDADTINLTGGMICDFDGAYLDLSGVNNLYLDLSNGKAITFNFGEEATFEQDGTLYFVVFSGYKGLNEEIIKGNWYTQDLDNRGLQDVAMGYDADSGTLYFSATAPVPEPTTATLSLLALAALAARRRRK